MRPFGLFLIAAALLAPLAGYVPLAAQYDVVPLFSQYIGVVALVSMAFSHILATRLPGLESVFGGLDRMYVLHKWLGIGGLAAVLVHDTIDADLPALGRASPLHDLAETLGEISLYGLLALVVITIVTFIPYSLWRWTHKLMGAFFTLSMAHYAFIMKPFSNGDPMGLGILAICLLGVACYLYTLVPYGVFQGRQTYKVADIAREESSVAVTLLPEGKGIRHRAGQFAFVRFDDPATGRKGETHPFTISKAPTDDRSLRFTVKALGDDTRRFPKTLSIGQTAKVAGPFGHFSHYRGSAPSVWIAAGVGVTPFAAWVGEVYKHQGPVHIVYCVRDSSDAAHLSELEAAAASDQVHLHLFESAAGKRLTVEALTQAVDVDWKQARVAYCGPQALREALKKGLFAMGLKRRHFHYEVFEIRSGLGVRKAVAWLLKRFGPKPVPASA